MGGGKYAGVNNIIELENIEIEVVTDPKEIYTEANELESIIFDLNSRIEMLSSKADLIKVFRRTQVEVEKKNVVLI